MRIYPIVLLSLFSMLMLHSCEEGVSYEDEVTGAWQGHAWLIDGEPVDRNADKVSFLFNNDSTYAARYGNQSEEGQWYVKENKLYTLAENQIQKMVVISRAKSDTLVLDMNRTGTPEQLILVRIE